MNYAKFNAREGLDFFDESRTHMQQGFVEMESEYRLFFNSTIKTSSEILRAMVGCKISQSEFLKIDSTVMATVLNEEPDFNIMATPSAAIKKPRNNMKELQLLDENTDVMKFINSLNEEEIDDALDDENEEEMLEKELEQLQMEDDINSKNQEATDDNQNSADVLLPYSSDVDYLDDHFQLMAAIMKKRFAEMDEGRDRKKRLY